MSGRSVAGNARSASVYDVLRNVRRRYVIYSVKSRGGAVHIDELVDQIANWENSHSDGDGPDARRRSVHNALVQTHLPKLDRHGFVQFDRSSRTVRPADRLETVEVYPPSQSIEWSRYFVLLSGVTLLFIGMDTLAVLPDTFETLPWESLALISFVVLASGYGYDRYQWRRRFRQDGPDVVIDDPGGD